MQKRPTITKLKAGRAFWHNCTDNEKNVVRLLDTPVEAMTREEMDRVVIANVDPNVSVKPYHIKAVPVLAYSVVKA